MAAQATADSPTPRDFHRLVNLFRQDGVKAIVLMGSFARRDAGAFSDVDLVRFRLADSPRMESQTHLVDQRFVVVSDVTPAEADACFTDPDRASACIAGLRAGRALWDPDGGFRVLQQRAEAFAWDEAMQAKADAMASGRMVGWIEEAQKGLEGLRRDDEGRMLNARHGLSWGLTNVLRVQRGILITGDNGTYSEVVASLGQDSAWSRLSRQAFGIGSGLSLREQVTAGLRLYVLTAELLAAVLLPEHAMLVGEAVKRIRSELAGVADGTPGASG